MRGFWHKFKRDKRGAVTVLVTLLLIPSVLVSGTGVDIARTYAAKSIVQDANQLAANSVLASYDALLQDLYGLYGVMLDDPELANMVDKYIRLTVLGEDWVDKEMGTFQLFYGSNLEPGDPIPAEEQNLDNPEVLRRQIEEYAKFRAPVIIVDEILNRLDTFESVKADAEVIDDKIEIDEKIEELEKLYREIYDKIQEVNKKTGILQSACESINAYMDDIRGEIVSLMNTRSSYEEAMENMDDECADELCKKYEGIVENINCLIKGGTIKEAYVMGKVNDEGEYEEGGWMSQHNTVGLNKKIQDYEKDMKSMEDLLDSLVSLLEKADGKKESLKAKVDALEQKLESGDCSDALVEGMTKKSGTTGKSLLDQYRALLKYDLQPMGEAVREYNTDAMNQFREILDRLSYTNQSYNPDVSLSHLRDLKADDIPINYNIDNQYNKGSDYLKDTLYKIRSINYEPDPDLEKFQSTKFTSTKNPEFYSELEKMGNSKTDKQLKTNVTEGLGNIFEEIQKQFVACFTFDPMGAYYYHNGSSENDSNSKVFGEDGDWSDTDVVKDKLQEALNMDILSSLGGVANNAANKILLLTYDTEMFSCYSTNDGQTSDKPLEENMNGIPMSTDVNYFFQSELEYLFNGNLRDARANLKAVTGMMFLVRFVFNYTASFTIQTVNNTVNNVEVALAEFTPFNIIAGETVRLILALGESVIDVSHMKSGYKVALIKNNRTWKFSIENLLYDIGNGVVGEIPSSTFLQKSEDDPGVSLSYKDYMRLFLLMKDGDTLAQRTAKLIELNVTNKKNNIGSSGDREAREAAMSSVELFDMQKAITGFNITTTVELRMLFLAMDFAQKGINGVIPSKTLSLSVTDYRGY